MRITRRLALGLALVAALALIVAPASMAKPGKGKGKGSGVTAIVPMKNETGAVVGLAWLSQKGQKVSGWVAVHGLPAGEWAWHVHAKGTCADQSASIVLDLGKIVIDAQGGAVVKVSATSEANVIKKGSYLNIHVGPDGAKPVCGDIKV